MNRFSHFIAAEAINKSNKEEIKVKSIQNKLFDSEDLLGQLKITSERISDKLPPAELHIVIS